MVWYYSGCEIVVLNVDVFGEIGGGIYCVI